MSIPYVEPQRSTMVSDVSNESGNADLLTNNLVYEQPKALSLAVNRTYTNQYFQRNEYLTASKSSTAVIDWNTGTSYVNVENSFLTFKIQTIGGDANFGCGSAMNIINEIRIRSRSGAELDRVELANLWSVKDSLYQKPGSYLSIMGSAQGFGLTRNGTDESNIFAAAARSFCLPLSVLAPFFRPMKKQLLPPQLASGLRIEIVWEDYRTALFQKTGTVTGYNLTDVRMVLDTVDMTDDTQRTINMESASEGLEYAYERVFTTIAQVPALQLNNSIQVRKAVSQACFATAMSLLNDNRVRVDRDSFISAAWPYSSYQFRLGSLYFPNQRVEISGGGLGTAESYMHVMATYDKIRHPYAETSISLTEYYNRQGILASSFEKDMNLNMSGLPINNSRVLELNLNYSSVSEQLDVVIFLTYCAVSRSYIDNTAVAS